MSLLLVPVYVRLLGMEAFGLIGFNATLQASLQILDLGLSQTMSRQMARYQAIPGSAVEARDFVRTVELAYWLIGLVVGIVIFAAAPWLATRWVRSVALPPGTIETAIRLMGVVTALQWPMSLYDGGLTGLQRQVLLNALKIGVASAGGLGTALVLRFVSPTITAYFAWQVAVSAAGVLALSLMLWRAMPGALTRPRIRPALVQIQARLFAGMGGIAVTGVLLSQADKVLLSKLLTLDQFGCYALASTVASVLPLLVAAPVFNGVFPRLTGLVASAPERAVADMYHGGTQLMAVLAATAGGLVAFFSHEIVLVWTGVPVTAAAVAPVASVLAVGMFLNALWTMPYGLQLAHGWTTLGLRLNVILIALLVPGIWIATGRWGAVGAAGAWGLLNLAYVLVGAPMTHRRLLRGELRAWFSADVLPPVLASVTVFAVGRQLVNPERGKVVVVASVAAVCAVALVGSVTAAPFVRRPVGAFLRRLLAREAP